MKEFPMKDGKLYTDPTGKYHKTDEQFLQSYWENRDPRFDKSIVWNGKSMRFRVKQGKDSIPRWASRMHWTILEKIQKLVQPPRIETGIQAFYFEEFKAFLTANAGGDSI
ncbi:RagB/SusD family nutrient uptake outer membrane protein [Sphingobacterium sp. E70]|uniref:RagB/SusD family nutrient uptake outer membrane protein n=1 Tax=Sphingobacterium sp. E70 TaxID=2853439 RepID=UPI00211CD15A|nr:RagB/SusD family nutrient uptake outer membrane protein [Sphingobacterium sp. E70]ULT28112.1 RagB/SusD family nutrient uptake outer membrane protein [Sphingobacterium sp. E70]